MLISFFQQIERYYMDVIVLGVTLVAKVAPTRTDPYYLLLDIKMSFYHKIYEYFHSKEIIKDAYVITVCIVFSVLIHRYYKQKPIEDYHSTLLYGDINYGVFSEERLSDYNGLKEKKLYVAVLGSVFNVSKGAKHYAKGGSYHYFVGKDGSRALITGDFTDESENKDNVIDLCCVDINNLLNWKATFQEKYDLVGVVKGRYYDKNGKETVYLKELLHRVNQCEEEKNASAEQERKYPPCNIAWNPDEGSKVWCTKASGGISRDWIGVPRQLYTPQLDKPHCVCVNLDTETSIGQFKEYDGCPKTAHTCIVDI